jgi:hypothetical protein
VSNKKNNGGTTSNPQIPAPAKTRCANFIDVTSMFVSVAHRVGN